MRVSPAVFLLSIALPLCGADWSPRLAADYLDARQKQWFAWPTANSPAKPCVSCHSGITYLMARPVLRKALGESEPTAYETGLLESLRQRTDKTSPHDFYPSNKEAFATQGAGVETIFAALFLGLNDRQGAALRPSALQALDRLWRLQSREGNLAGAWQWFTLDLDPWEMPESPFYGATLAAYAVGSAPAEYRARPDVKERTAALTAYLNREAANQPLQNRLMLLWASTKLPEAVAESTRKSIAADAWKAQQADGSWTIESLGPWKKHAAAPPSSGSNSYASAYMAWALQSAGPDKRMARALGWLRTHQNPQTGAWAASSMNKVYEAGSVPELFMQDAATAYASLALLSAKK